MYVEGLATMRIVHFGGPTHEVCHIVIIQIVMALFSSPPTTSPGLLLMIISHPFSPHQGFCRPLDKDLPRSPACQACGSTICMH